MWILIRKLIQDPAFAATLRDDWALRDHLIAANLNATMALRSDVWAAAFGQKLPYKPVISPSAERQEKAEADQVKSLHDSIIGQLKGQA